MLLYKLKELECILEKNPSKNRNLLNRVSYLKKLLLDINYKAEVIPEGSFDELMVLFTTLKGKALTTKETQIIKELL